MYKVMKGRVQESKDTFATLETNVNIVTTLNGFRGLSVQIKLDFKH